MYKVFTFGGRAWYVYKVHGLYIWRACLVRLQGTKSLHLEGVPGTSTRYKSFTFGGHAWYVYKLLNEVTLTSTGRSSVSLVLNCVTCRALVQYPVGAML
ncbi:hypothetical protein RRG08_050797 [Elysia crispata]|uniref:Uncharacterized protein n=1 Tax=Elysia crispata TaxID=231223 RepID=A0AAE0YHF8_9GAST|nr:hypothetical protein RRG08_050797 [Elysia crispata]